jgi:hypothetical protein
MSTSVKIANVVAATNTDRLRRLLRFKHITDVEEVGNSTMYLVLCTSYLRTY